MIEVMNDKEDNMNITATATVHTATCTCGTYTPIMPGLARFTCRCGTTYLVPDQDSFAYGETKALVTP